MPHELFDLFYDRLLHLNLSYNGLTKISENMQKLVLLKELNLSHNQIDFIDPAISCCVRLRRLNVSCNNLTTLPAELSHCRLLVSLGCVWKWFSIKDTIIPLMLNLEPSIKESLLCSDNKLRMIPTVISKQLVALETLDLRNNRLLQIPLAFGNMVRVIWVHIMKRIETTLNL